MMQLTDDINYSDNSHLWPGGFSIKKPWWEALFILPRNQVVGNREFGKLELVLARAGLGVHVQYQIGESGQCLE